MAQLKTHLHKALANRKQAQAAHLKALRESHARRQAAAAATAAAAQAATMPPTAAPGRQTKGPP